MPSQSDAEGAVRLYLMYLDNPEGMLDEAAIKKAEAAVEKAKDPIDKLKALSELERAKAVDPEPFRQGFIDHAKTWAEAEGIPVRAFLEMGVPAKDLTEAGLVPPRGSRGRSSASGKGRAPRMSLDEVAAKLPSGQVKVTDLAEAIGRETTTTRNYLNKLVEAGKVAEVGDDPNHDGRGKAPKLYEAA